MLYKIVSVRGNLAKKTTSLSYVLLEENGGNWECEHIHYKKIEIGFSSTIHTILQMPVTAFNELSAEVSAKLAVEIGNFMREHQLDHKVDFIAFGGLRINDQVRLGNIANIATATCLPVAGDFHHIQTAVKTPDHIYAVAGALLKIEVEEIDENKNIALALLAALRWREAYNVRQQTNDNTQNYIAGSIWLGVEA